MSVWIRRRRCLAILLPGCTSSDKCDFIDMQEPVRISLYTTTQLSFWVGSLSPDLRKG